MSTSSPSKQHTLKQSISSLNLVGSPSWDSSDPFRNPPPLPLNPASPPSQSPSRQLDCYSPDFVKMSDKSSSAKHNRVNSITGGGTVRDRTNLFGGSLSPTKKTSKDLMSVTKDNFKDGSPIKLAPKITENPPPKFELRPHSLKSFENQQPNPHHHGLNGGLNGHDFDRIAESLNNLTAIANQLTREMNSLSRRSKDNATDLISLKEATKTRDEDIRKAIKELVQGLSSMDPNRPPSVMPPRFAPTPAPGKDSSALIHTPGVNGGADFSLGPEMAILERIMRDMATKGGEDRLLGNIQELKRVVTKDLCSKAGEVKIMGLLEEVKDDMSTMNEDVNRFMGVVGNVVKTGEVNVRGNSGSAAPSEELMGLLKHIEEGVEGGRVGTDVVREALNTLRGEMVNYGKATNAKIEHLIREIERLANVTIHSSRTTLPTPAPSLGPPSTTSSPAPGDLSPLRVVNGQTNERLNELRELIETLRTDFRKANGLNANGLVDIARYLDKIKEQGTVNYEDGKEFRKVLEVIRMGTQSMNDRIVSFENEVTNRWKQGMGETRGDELDSADWRIVRDHINDMRKMITDILPQLTKGVQELFEGQLVKRDAGSGSGSGPAVGSSQALDRIEKNVANVKSETSEMVAMLRDNNNINSIRDLVRGTSQETLNTVKSSIDVHNAKIGEIVDSFKKQAVSTIRETTESLKSTSASSRELVESIRADVTKSKEGTIGEISRLIVDLKEDTVKAVEAGMDSNDQKIARIVQCQLDMATSDLKETREIALNKLTSRVIEATRLSTGGSSDVSTAEIVSKTSAVVNTEIQMAKEEIISANATSASELKNAVFINAMDARDSIKEDVAKVRSAVESSKVSVLDEQKNTQKVLTEVMGLVGGLQGEWKGSQPKLFNALQELKSLLKEAESVGGKRGSQSGTMQYDDSAVQDKLDHVILHTTQASKRFPQLDLLDTIHRQVISTSHDISEFIALQTEHIKDTTSEKIRLQKSAEVAAERARGEEKALLQSSRLLQTQNDTLDATRKILVEDLAGLTAKKTKAAADLASIEAALSIRREEILQLESRAEALERRLVQGVIDQSRALLMSKPGRSPFSNQLRRAPSNGGSTGNSLHPPKLRQAAGGAQGTPGRRHLSLGPNSGLEAASNNGTSASKPAGRVSLGGVGPLNLGNITLAPSANFTTLKRSQSVKVAMDSNSARRTAEFARRNGSLLNPETQAGAGGEKGRVGADKFDARNAGDGGRNLSPVRDVGEELGGDEVLVDMPMD